MVGFDYLVTVLGADDGLLQLRESLLEERAAMLWLAIVVGNRSTYYSRILLLLLRLDLSSGIAHGG